MPAWWGSRIGDRLEKGRQVPGQVVWACVFCSGLALGDLPTILYEPPAGRTAPPFLVLALASACGALTLVGVALLLLLRRNGAVHLIAGSRVASVLLGIPSMVSTTGAGAVRVFALVSVPLCAVALLLLYGWGGGRRPGVDR